MTAWLERAAAGWFERAWYAGGASLFILAVVLLVWGVARRRLSPHLSSRLLLLPLLPLLVPSSPLPLPRLPGPRPPAFVAAGDLLGSAEDLAMPTSARRAPPGERSAATARPDPGGVVLRDEAARPLPERGSLSLRARLALGWWCLSLALLVSLALGQRPLRRIARAADHPEDRSLQRRFARLVRQSGAPARTRLLQTDALSSPAVTGVFRPAVLVPREFLAALDPVALDFVLLHELAHVRRRDVPIELAVRIARALWPLHPATWAGPALATRERELACDETALARLGAAAGPRAARGLVTLLEHERVPRANTAGTPSLFLENLSRERVMRLLHPPRRVRPGLSAPAATALALCAFGTLAAVPALPAAVVVESTAVRGTAPLDEEEALLTSALLFLTERQAEDGRWAATSDPDLYGCGELDDVGVTGAVLLALLDAPPELGVPGSDRAVRRGLAFLAAGQDPESGWFPAVERNIVAVPSHALATWAWARARILGVTDADARRLQAAVRALLSARNPYAGWRYGIGPDGDNDAVITGWSLLALAEARRAGAEVPERAASEALALLEKLYDPETGRTGYGRRGEPTSRLAGRAESFPPEAVEFPTAVAVAARVAWGQDPVETDAILAGAALLARKAPRWSREDGTIDAYYWAFGTLAVEALGGAPAERWRSSLREALLAGVERDEAGNASWPAIDAWSAPGGEAAMTAFCVLALEAAREAR